MFLTKSLRRGPTRTEMCGIAGIIRISPKAKPVTTEELDAMKAGIAHRGPDGQDIQILQDGSGFCHTRLSVIDLDERSKQPFSSQDGKYVMVYNGEIFNYVELRSELEKLGCQFRTESDTEVLLQAYIQWGSDCVNRLNGMWAFVIFDSVNHTVFGSRDRFGIKPFVYGIDQDRLYFASEAKAILAVAPRFRKPNFDSLSLLLRSSISGYNAETCFVGLSRLKPAHNLLIKDGEVSIPRYWDYPSVNPEYSDYEQACSRLRDLLSDAIRLRLRSDVPIGLTLSGGVDSSVIACMTKNYTDSRLHTYTASFQSSDDLDESEKAKRLASSLGFKSSSVGLVRADVERIMRSSIYHLETPHHSVAILPYWNIAQNAQKNVTVLLEGQGADEMLGGYLSFTTMSALRDDINNIRCWEALKRIGAGLSGELGFSRNRFAMDLVRSLFPGLHDTYRKLRGDEAVYIQQLRNRPSRTNERKLPASQKDPINRTLIHQHERGLVNLLQYGDAISMAHGLESRLPFMDHRLVEFSFQLPGSFKLRNGWGKAILRDATRDILPDYVVNDKRKLGFPAPLAEWFKSDIDIARDVLLSKQCRERGVFDTKRIEKLLDAHVAGKVNLFSNIYRWMMTEIWFQTFIDT